MRLPEFIEAVESYGVPIPAKISTYGQVDRRYWEPILGPLPRIGQGNHRAYSPRMVRRLVAWSMIGEATGRANGTASPLHREATEVMAAMEHGWVVMSGRWVYFYDDQPPTSVFDKGAVCLPVPEWRH